MTNSGSSPAPSTLKVLAVRLGESLHGIPIEAIEEILPALPVEPIAQCPEFVGGVVVVRGHRIPVLEAAQRLGIRHHVRPLEPHIVCMRWSGRLVGLEVDEALDLMELPASARLAAGDLGAQGGFLSAVIEHQGQVIRVLDPAQLLAPSEAQSLQRLPQTP